jgi:hypothetical protein
MVRTLPIHQHAEDAALEFQLFVDGLRPPGPPGLPAREDLCNESSRRRRLVHLLLTSRPLERSPRSVSHHFTVPCGRRPLGNLGD